MHIKIKTSLLSLFLIEIVIEMLVEMLLLIGKSAIRLLIILGAASETHVNEICDNKQDFIFP